MENNNNNNDNISVSTTNTESTNNDEIETIYNRFDNNSLQRLATVAGNVEPIYSETDPDDFLDIDFTNPMFPRILEDFLSNENVNLWDRQRVAIHIWNTYYASPQFKINRAKRLISNKYNEWKRGFLNYLSDFENWREENFLNDETVQILNHTMLVVQNNSWMSPDWHNEFCGTYNNLMGVVDHWMQYWTNEDDDIDDLKFKTSLLWNSTTSFIQRLVHLLSQNEELEEIQIALEDICYFYKPSKYDEFELEQYVFDWRV